MTTKATMTGATELRDDASELRDAVAKKLGRAMTLVQKELAEGEADSNKRASRSLRRIARVLRSMHFILEAHGGVLAALATSMQDEQASSVDGTA
jgi:hypothetical protein